MDCEQKWEFRYAYGLVPHGPDYIWFSKGSYIHDLCHLYYGLLKSGFEIGDQIITSSIRQRISEDIAKALSLAESQEGAPVDFEFFNQCSTVILNYIEKRSPVIDTGVQKLEVEKHLEWEIEGRILHGFVDLIYWDPKEKVWVIRDHKTGGKNSYTTKNVYRNLQLRFYATLFYLLTGEVPHAEINFLHSDPPKNPVKTQIWGTYRAAFKKEELEGFRTYLSGVHKRQQNLTVLQDFTKCGNCAYFPICGSDLKGLSKENIIKGMYARKEDQSRDESSEETSKVKVNPTFNFGRRND